MKILVGKTIEKVTTLRKKSNVKTEDQSGWYDDQYIRLYFTDGTKIIIGGGFNDWTGDSENEYPTFVYYLFPSDESKFEEIG